ncbi:hypothetical protein ASG73_06985 [Janibacter sp. Soil728]|nr:hypothetical protein ASG73_06985 [Janibacter sp. Soil728]
MSTESLTGDRQAAKEVLRTRRRATHAPSPLQVLQDWYVGLFIAATLLTMLFAATGPAILQPDCDTAVCLDAGGHDVVALVAAALGLLAAVVGLRAVGPVSADPGQASWLLSTPADRALLLRGQVLRVLLVAVVAGASWGVLVGFAVASGAGLSAAPVVSVVACAAVGLLVCLLLTPITLRRQGGSFVSARAARAVPDGELARAGQVVQAVTAATLMLDTVALEVLAARRRLARRGRYASRPGAGGPLPSILVHEFHALARRSRQLLTALLSCVGALVVGLLLGRLAGAVLAALVVFAVARTSAGGLSTWLTTPGLRRALPDHPGAVAAVLAVPPFVMAVVGSLIAVGALGLPWWAPVAFAFAAMAGAMRACDPPPDLGAAFATPGGAVHVGLIQRLVLGPDIVLAGAAVVLIGAAVDQGPLALLACAGLAAWQLLRPRD